MKAKLACWLGFHHWLEWVKLDTDHNAMEVCLKCWGIRYFYWGEEMRKRLRDAKS